MSGAGAVRLRPLVETVVGDEHLWLLRGPAGGDCRIADPSPAVLALVELLDGAGGTPRELTTALRRDGLPTEEAEVAGMLAALDAAALLEPVRPDPEDDRFSRSSSTCGSGVRPAPTPSACSARCARPAWRSSAVAGSGAGRPRGSRASASAR